MTETEKFFDLHNIEYKGVPRDILIVAKRTVESIEAGVPFIALGGTRMRHDRNKISFEVTRRWRLTVEDIDGHIKIMRVMSHEKYNRWCNNR